jgi:phosphoribosylamine--glycine ligase
METLTHGFCGHASNFAQSAVRILIIGSGGREHALTWKLKQSSGVDRIFCAPGNAGTAQLAENVAIGASDLAALVRFAKQNHIDLTVVGPDDPLALGIVDLFTAQGLRAFGPTKTAARLESSKIFAKELMRKEGIPTARARTFSDSDEAVAYCQELRFPIVIKADGLALGKGVIIAPDLAAARSTIEAMMIQRRFGEAGRRVVIEEFLHGSECSLHALVDGTNYRLLATARDHKRAFDGDRGPNTGGMGAFSPANNWTRD